MGPRQEGGQSEAAEHAPGGGASSACSTMRFSRRSAPPARASARPASHLQQPQRAEAAEQRAYSKGTLRSSWRSRPPTAPASTSTSEVLRPYSATSGGAAWASDDNKRAALCCAYGCGDQSSPTAGGAATADSSAACAGCEYCDSAAAATPAPNGPPCRMSQTRSSSIACAV